MRLCALLVVLAGVHLVAPGPTGWRLPGRSPRFERPGDVVLGGSFSILHFHSVAQLDFVVPPSGLPASRVSRWGYRVAQCFVFAVEEINRNPHLLPNLTLGFSIRNSGDSVHGALHETMSFLTGQEDPVPNYVCQSGPPRAALVGDTRSALSVAMARLLGLYKFPQVSYSSTLPSLSDKTQFPSFLRTRASDLTSSHAITQLVLHLGWSWVGILAQDDDFGQQAGTLATQELGQAGVCIEFHLHVPSLQSMEKIDAIVWKMEKSTATGVLVFLSNSNIQLILQRLVGFCVLGQVWVSEGLLYTVIALATPGASWVLQGAFGLMLQSGRAHGFPKFFARLHPSQTPEDMFLGRFWEATFGCRWPHDNDTVARDVRLCSGHESLRGHEYPFQDISRVDAAYPAVYSVAHALQDMVSCEQGDKACEDPRHFQPWQLLHPLRKVRFQTPDGTHIMFDANGDLVTKFDILQSQQSPEGQFHFVHIGRMEPHRSPEDRMMIFLKDDVQVPSSVCGTSCEPGFSQIAREGAPHCCFECRPCSEGQFADQRDMQSCRQCPEELYPSQTRDRCLPRTETFLAFDEPLGLALTLVVLALAGLACLVLGVFLRFRDTPVVRANNRALSYVLLASLALCALCPLLFLGRPSPTTCLLRQTTFAVVFTVAVSCVLAKTLTVVLAFRVTRPGQRVLMCLRPSASSSMVFVSSLMQVILCGAWLGTSPPFPQKDATSEPGHLVLLCQEGSGVAFSCVLGYLGLLAVGTFSVAFLARDLPDTFNETKFLTFSMLLFCSVWTAFLPLYHSARGKATVAVEVFSILASTAGLLGGIFLPKCYLILLKPERNTLFGLRPGPRSKSGCGSLLGTGVPPGLHHSTS
ncbi:extracellular calcium-sensing receptor [Fukomys damarensis]|uniref:Vomeronasal type-2 receptor 26 n=1 Tax=Fukomys damarensis TaxID=885580 RepID=A0A091E1K6_FUKDA|nr:extracellular calcium-sensing receptor [Fukomys damarensis]KFO36455.1 Vomeronasal type-2 receptor 26 [Fukomys damarensis]